MDTSASPEPIRPRASGSATTSEPTDLGTRGSRDGNLGFEQSWRFLCLAELANFAELRRHLGQVRADRLAADIAARISHVLPHARLAVVGRTQVEFMFGGADRDELRRAIRILADVFSAPAEFDRERYELHVVFGAAAAHAPGVDEIRLAEEAEDALASARVNRTGGPEAAPGRAPQTIRSALTAELPKAIATGQLFLHFQPKLNLRRREIVGVEALLRWEHPVRGLILPNDFIASAEISKHIVGLTLWTLRQAIDDQLRLAEHGYDIPVFLNISGHLLGDDEFVRSACEIVRNGRAKIGLEITETAVIRDPDAAIANLQRFANIGVPIAIDDYGAGLSSLSYLKRLPAAELKIDKMFVTHLTSSNRDPLIVRSTIDLAHALEMEVTAEGVENPSTLALLSVMGCDSAQGFLISRPLGFGSLLQYLNEDKHLDVAADPRATPGGLVAVWKRV